MTWLLIIVIIVLIFIFLNKESDKLDDGDKYFKLGRQFHGERNFDAAIEEYSKYIALYPKSYVVYNNRGLSKMSKGDFQGAIEDFNKSIALEPDTAKNNKVNSNFRVAQESLRLEKENQTEREINRSKLEENLRRQEIEDLKKQKEFIDQGEILLQNSDISSALKYFHKALDIQEDEDILWIIVSAYINIEDTENALFYSNKLLKINSKHYDALVIRALIYFGKGMLQEVKENIILAKKNQSLSDVGGESDTLLGNLLIEIGKKTTKEDALEVFFVIYPNVKNFIINGRGVTENDVVEYIMMNMNMNIANEYMSIITIGIDKRDWSY
jgi:tetratricopeptide (TPR) repeat protein